MTLKLFHAMTLALGLWQFAAADPPAVPEIRFPEQQAAPIPPAPNAPIRLVKGQFYAVQSTKPLLILQSGTGKVSVSLKTGTFTFPFESVPGWMADAADPDFVTLSGPYTYLVKPLATGDVQLQIIPALNAVDAKGKQVPLVATDVAYKLLAVDMGEGPRPPPPPPADPLLSVLQAAYDAEPATTTKSSDKTQLAAIFRALATAVTDPVVKTGDDNFALITNSIQARIDGRLKVKLRPTIGAEINKILPNGAGKGTVPLTVQDRTAAAALYLRIATLLDEVK